MNNIQNSSKNQQIFLLCLMGIFCWEVYGLLQQSKIPNQEVERIHKQLINAQCYLHDKRDRDHILCK